VPEQNKKLAGFEALYKVDQDRRQQRETSDAASAGTVTTQESAAKPERTRSKVSKSESNIVSNITQRTTSEVFEPTTFKADRRKVKALKRLALDLDPARKLDRNGRLGGKSVLIIRRQKRAALW
jgi:hypothetical protein